MNDTFAVIYAGHGNPLLGELIAHRCVGALPVAGRFRTIDFLLSNISSSGIRAAGVIMQRNFQSLVEHIGSGDAWDLNNKRGGVALLTPFDQGLNVDSYREFGDALYAKRYYLERQHARYCLLLTSDYLYREDYGEFLERHIDMNADITVMCTRNREFAEADSAHGARLLLDQDGWIVDAGETVGDDAGAVTGIGACIMDKDLLIQLVEDACAVGRYDFIEDILKPAVHTHRVAAFEHVGYVSRLDSVKSYYNMMKDTLSSSVRMDLFFERGPVYTRVMDAPPARYCKGCEVANSVLGNGCEVSGRVRGCILFRGIKVEEGADAENCVIMQDSYIGAGAYLRNAIIDKNSLVKPGARLVGTPDSPIVIRKGTIVE